MKTPPLADPPPPIEPKAPLRQLKKWPTAWRSDSDCVIDKVRYPAPDSLGEAEVEWWLDCTSMRLDAAKSMINALFGAIIGAAFGVSLGSLASSVSSDPWAPFVSLMLGLVVIAAIGFLTLRDSDHPALEQRWLLYRERARQLSAGGQDHPLLAATLHETVVNQPRRSDDPR